MGYALKRLSLGIFLILLASGVLLVSDLKRRTANKGPVASNSAAPGSTTANSTTSGTTSIPKVALFQFATRPILEEGVQGIHDALRQNGFENGKNLQIKVYNAENDLPTANSIAKEIAGGDFDMVITVSTPCLQVMASANRDRKMTHIFGLVTDPAASGVGISKENPLDHPSYLAGMGTFQPVREAFQIAKKMNPDLKTVGVVWNPAETCSEACCILARDECKKLGITLVEAQVDATAGVREAADSLVARGVEALWLGGDNTVEMAAAQLVQSGERGQIPVFANAPGHPKIGALFGIGANYVEVGRRVGEMASQVLKGSLKPASVEIKNVMPAKLSVSTAALERFRSKNWSLPEEVRQTVHELYDEKGQMTPGPATTAAAATAAPAVPAAPAPQPAVQPAPLAEGKVYRIGVTYFGPDPGTELGIRGFFDGMKALGYVEGKNLEIVTRHAQGEMANVAQIITSFEGEDLDLLVPLTTPNLTAAVGSYRSGPIVFTVVYDPVAAGAGKSLEDHAPNVTGIGSLPPVEETFKAIKLLVPGVKTIGTLYNPSEANSCKVIEVAKSLLDKMDLKLEEVPINTSADIYQAAQVVCTRGIQALWVTGDNTALQGFPAIVKAARENHIPFINNDQEALFHGSLAAVGLGFYEPGYAAAAVADRVLKGESPARIPMQNLSAKRIALNFETAAELKMDFPASFIKDASYFVGIGAKVGHPLKIAVLGASGDTALQQTLSSGFEKSYLKPEVDFTLVAVDAVPAQGFDALIVAGQANAAIPAGPLPTLSFAPEKGADISSLAQACASRLVRSILQGPLSPPSIQTGPLSLKKKWNVRLIKLVEEATADAVQEGFLDEAHKLGLVDGDNWEFSVKSAQGDMATTSALIDDTLSSNTDMLIAVTTPVLQNAIKKIKDIPVVFSGVADPVRAGAGASFEDHMANVTGVSTMSDFDGMVAVVRECLPQAKRIGTLFVPAEINSVIYRDALATAAQKAGMELVSVAVSNSAEVLEGANSLCGKEIDVICQISDNTNNVGFAGIANAARQQKIPLLAFVSQHVRTGGAAISVARDYEQAGRDAAQSALRIMKGESPAQIPFSVVQKTTIIVNQANAELCGLALPQSLLQRANEVIKN